MYANNIDSDIQHLMEIINSIQINNSILNTSRHDESEILERINGEYIVANEIIEYIYNVVNEKQTVHVSFPLVVMIRDRLNYISRIERDLYIQGMKWFHGAGLNTIDLDIIFNHLRWLRWVVTNLPIDDSNTWVNSNNLDISYNKVQESIDILEKINDDIFRLGIGNHTLNTVTENINLLIDISDENSNSFFYEIIIHKLNIIQINNTKSDEEILFWQLLKLDGLFQYIK